LVKITGGVKKAKLESYSFPKELTVNVKSNWSMVVTNVGDVECYINARITNSAGNPGNMIVTFAGTDYTMPPGSMWQVSDIIPPGGKLSVSGQVRFDKPGSYTIRLSACHESVEDEGVDLDG
jgi:hypothetical protein